MGQIVFNNQKPKYCKLQAIRPGGQHVNDDVALNEVWLVDTTDSQKSGTGTGEYDAYIIGDGSLKAGQLPLHYLPKMGDIPTNLSQLISDTNHQTVSQTEKDTWNAGGAGEIVNNVDNEDLTSVEIAEDVRVIKFKDKEYNSSNYSGYGKTYLRKNFVTELERTIIDITPAVGTDEEDPSEDPEETAEKIKNYYVNLGAGIDGTAVITSRVNVGYLRKEVFPGDVLYFQAYTKGSVSGWFYGIIDKTTNQIYYREGNYPEEDVTQHEGYVSIELPEGVESAYLVVNIVTYDNPIYSIKKVKKLDTEKEFNILGSIIGNNTIFEVNYDYDLNYRILRLPENSVLKFNGGSIKNAIIFGNNTTIIADGNDNIFGRNTEVLGTWKTNTWYAKWFGVYADGVRDDTPVLQRMLELAIKTGSKNIILNWYDCVFRTTKGLFIRDYTTILGGTIKAKFDNPLDWVLQTYSLYNGTKVVRYNGLLASDEGRATLGGFIKDLTIRGELNDNGDGTWAPIFGGIRLMTTSMATENVDIRYVGYGIARAATVVARDTNLVSWAYFSAYLTNYVINLEVNTAYFQAYCHHTVTGPDDTAKHIPFTTEYHPVDGFLKFDDTFIDGNGGIDDTDDEHRRPRLTALKASSTSAIFNNVAMDMWQEIGFALGDYCEIQFNTTRFEAVGGDGAALFLRGNYIKATLNTVIVSLYSPIYDIYVGQGIQNTINLISSPALACSGYGNSNVKTHKFYAYDVNAVNINVHSPRNNEYPNLDCFHFIGDNDISINITPNGYENVYTWGNGTYINPSIITSTNRRKLTVPADTTVYLSGDIFNDGITITGENRNTSIVKLNGALNLGNNNSKLSSIEFRNLTLDCSNGVIYTYTNLYGDGGNLTFVKCNIINSKTFDERNNAYGFIRGESKYSILYDVKFDNCNIYSKVPNVFCSGTVRIDDIPHSPSLSSPIVRYGSIGDSISKNIKLDFINKGTEVVRNIITYHICKGHKFYNITTGRTEIWNGRQWVLDDGYPYTESKGVTANIPALPLMRIGTEYEDTEAGIKKILTANGTCGYGTFAFNAVFPVSTKTFYVGTTAVTPDSNGAFSVNLPAGIYPVYCVEGNKKYECQPSTITISGSITFPIYIKESKYSTKFEIKIDAVDDNGEFIQGLTVRVGPYVATENTTGKYYSVSIPNGQYMITADGYADQTSLYVNGLADRVTAIFETEAPTNPETVTLDGYLYDHDHICDSNGTNIVAGKYGVSVDSTSLEVSLTANDLSTILYFIDDAISDVNKQLDYLLIKKWFEAGHYGEYVNNAGAKLYSDTVGTITGNSATFTDTSTNLVCTVAHTAGTNATWEVVPSGSSSDSSMNIVAASGTSLTASANTYYTFAAAVNTLAVTLPAMTNVTSVKALCLAFTAGTTPQITFTASDGKTVVYYNTYGIDAECEYEVTCLYNGTKWIVSSALIS